MRERDVILSKTKGRCFYCGCTLSKGWHSDHFHPIIRKTEIIETSPIERMATGNTHKYKANGESLYPGLDTIDNKVPSCPPCNLFKSSSSIEGYRAHIKSSFDTVLNQSSPLRQLNRLGVVDVSEKPIVFYFETIGIEMKSPEEMMGISKQAIECKWKYDEVDNCQSVFFERHGVTLRKIKNHYLAIITEFGTWQQERKEIPIMSEEIARAITIDWALDCISNWG